MAAFDDVGFVEASLVPASGEAKAALPVASRCRFRRARPSRQRGPYQLRRTFATEALAAGIPIFELARVMGTRVKMVDRTYGHLARDSEQAIRSRLDERGRRSGDVVATGAVSDRRERKDYSVAAGDSYYGSDGTRTRGLRRDRPAL
jgi:hypothetical protein